MKGVLKDSGELMGKPDPGSWFPYRSANAIHKLTQAEPGFRKKFGQELPVLRFGGPGSDAYGLAKKH